MHHTQIKALKGYSGIHRNKYIDEKQTYIICRVFYHFRFIYQIIPCVTMVRKYCAILNIMHSDLYAWLSLQSFRCYICACDNNIAYHDRILGMQCLYLISNKFYVYFYRKFQVVHLALMKLRNVMMSQQHMTSSIVNMVELLGVTKPSYA